MAELKERLRADLNAAMRARDQVRMRTLRLALTSITNEEVAGASARDLTDDEVVRVLTREAKKRREAAEAFSATTGAPGRRSCQSLIDSLVPTGAMASPASRCAAISSRCRRSRSSE